SGELTPNAVDNEEDRWNNNLVALQARIVERYRNTDPPQAIKAAMRRVSELVGEAQTLRKDLADINVSTVERHDSTRSTQLRIGAAIDTLAIDEARAAQEFSALSSEHKRIAERLTTETQRVLGALAAYDEAEAKAKSSANDGAAAPVETLISPLREWADAQ